MKKGQLKDKPDEIIEKYASEIYEDLSTDLANYLAIIPTIDFEFEPKEEQHMASLGLNRNKNATNFIVFPLQKLGKFQKNNLSFRCLSFTVLVF